MSVQERVRVAAVIRRAWSYPVQLSGLGELVACWLEGALPYNPDHGGGPAEETGPLVPVLAAVNRTGLLVTDASQPGVREGYGDDGRVWRQRAAVEGYATEAALKLLHPLAANTAGIELRFSRPTRRWRYGYERSLEVTQSRKAHYEWRTHTDFGASIPRHQIGHGSFSGVNAELVRELQRCWRFTLVDLQWGRNDALWPLLAHFTDLVAWQDGQHPLAAPRPSGRHSLEDW